MFNKKNDVIPPEQLPWEPTHLLLTQVICHIDSSPGPVTSQEIVMTSWFRVILIPGCIVGLTQPTTAIL